MNWVNELSQVAGTMRAGKAIGVDYPAGSVPIGGQRLLVPACGSCETSGQLQSISRCVERWHHVWCPNSNSTMIGKVLNRRVSHVVGKTSKPWQIGCRPGFGIELQSLISVEFLQMCKQQRRPAANLFAELKGAFCHALLEQVVGPYCSETDLLAFFLRGLRLTSGSIGSGPKLVPSLDRLATSVVFRSLVFGGGRLTTVPARHWNQTWQHVCCSRVQPVLSTVSDSSEKQPEAGRPGYTDPVGRGEDLPALTGKQDNGSEWTNFCG